MLKKLVNTKNAVHLFFILVITFTVGVCYTPVEIHTLINIAKDEDSLTLVYEKELENEEDIVIAKVPQKNINRIIPVESVAYQSVIFYEDNTFDIYLAKTQTPPID